MNLEINVSALILISLMAIELGAGICIGFLRREIAKYQARRCSENIRAFRREEYISRGYGERSPDNNFSVFGLDSTFVVVKFDGGEVVEETFYSSLGESVSVRYRDDGRTSTSASFLSSPLYALAIVLPLVAGFIMCAIVIQFTENSFRNAYELSSLLGSLGIHLLVSGVIWSGVNSIFVARSFIQKSSAHSSKAGSAPTLNINSQPVVVEREEQTASWLKKFFWVFLILGTTGVAIVWHLNSLDYIAQNPDLQPGYHTLILNFLLWSNIPWLVVGVGCLTQNLTLKDYLKPQSIHPYLIGFFASLLLVFVVGSYWLLMAGGAEVLVQYPGLFISNSGAVLDSKDLEPESIKLWWIVDVASAISTMALVLIRANRPLSS